MRSLSLLFIALASLSGAPAGEVWKTCSLIEGKGDSCGTGDAPAGFADYLKPGSWAKATKPEYFSSEFEWDLKQLGPGTLKVSWREIGTLARHRIRQVDYQAKNGHRFATLLL